MDQKEIKTNSFPKSEKLCSQISIDRLFTKGESFISYPLRVVYFVNEETDANDPSFHVLVSVSKRKFKRAVKRNRVKRLIREAYRLNKQSATKILTGKNRSIDIGFIYLKDELPTYSEIDKAVKKAFSKLTDKLDSV